MPFLRNLRKLCKKDWKMFADIKIIPTFASAITKKVLYKANEGRFLKRVSESKNEEIKKKFAKSS